MFAIEFNNLTYKLNNGTKILHSVSGKCQYGKLICILGPSGAGKTTLLNILSGYNTNYEGHLKIKNKTSSNQHAFCYIQQENHLEGLLTVKEYLEIAYELKIGRIDMQSISQINNLLKNFKLDALTQSYVCSLSGGEKKRLSIALELINEPQIIFLDEPTTGLDFVSCNIVLNYLKQLACAGKTIICTIHQPSASQFFLFDDAFVLSQGNCIYQGKCDNVLNALIAVQMRCQEFHNPADFKIANGEYGQNVINELIDLYKQPIKSEESDCLDDRSDATECNRKIRKENEFCLLLKKEFIKAKRNPTLTYLRLITAVVNSLLVCALFWKVGSDASKIWYNFNAIINCHLHMIAPSLLTILAFPTELHVLRRECFNRWYKLKTAYLAITISDLPIAFIYCLVSTAIVYYLTEQPLELYRFFMFSTIAFLVCINAQSFGLLFGALFTIINGMFVLSILIFVFMMLAGFGIRLTDLPKFFQMLSYTSYLRYGVEGMVGAVNGYNRSKLHCPEESFCYYTNTNRFLEDMGINGESFSFDVCILFAMFIFLRIVTYFVLVRKVNKR